MADNSKIGVFLCECGRRIAPLVDLKDLAAKLEADPLVDYVAVEPFSCLAPGLDQITKAVEEKGLDRVVIAGCEARVMLKKFQNELAATGLEEGQIDIVNLRGHVAQVSDLSPEEKAAKGFKLIKAVAAGLDALAPSVHEQVEFKGPVMILGGGIATYSAAQELSRREIESIIAVSTDEWEDEIRMLHEHYPGERHYYDRMEAIMRDVDASPFVRRITVGELSSVSGRTGEYLVTFSDPMGGPPRVYEVGAIIAALDGQMLNQGTNFGHDGRTVICHTEAEELLWTKGVPEGQIVFWINDYEAGHPEYAYLASRAAWSMARYMRERSPLTKVTVLYNHQMPVPLSAGERAASRKLGIDWVAYDGALRPTVQAGYVTYCDPEDHTEQEMPWDRLILSPRRSVGQEATKVAHVLGLEHVEGHFLEPHKQRVRPEMVGRAEAFLAGSARYPCDLHEALRQGRRAASKTAEMVEKAQTGELFAPRMVCTVDQSKCIGCGLCKEICDCGGIEPVEGHGGNIPRHVDPMVCTGGGTCAAACPYHALTLQNNTTSQREARVSTLSKELAADEILSFGCAWGGLAAADNAGVKGLKYDPRMYMLRVGCIGQLDPSVMARAFLEGANSLLLIGCPPEDCHHSYGLDHTWSRVNLIKKLLHLCGFDRRRIALAHADLNNPEEYIRTVNSFVNQMADLGPIERNSENLEKLAGLYATVNNARVRWVLGATLRRPWEEIYPGNQRNALAFDRDMMGVVSEEFIKSRVANLLRDTQKPYQLHELANALQAEEKPLMESVREMVGEGLIGRMHKDGKAHYMLRA
ncbi:MAG: hydrogenase iron-sulfur subunit [Desulfarculaceae bacterium]|nr:hydrogenase iron-sulfur subunit [Desulfarculaceae bacterium]MCF8073010.1 hydrogenase iron-sulfur subunit [Desulfarculaceae bacterium]MCF8115432.1 hydrogenase iron-sulfur subunit [Desulfarculaceae bacterium]